MSHPQTTFQAVTFDPKAFWGKKRAQISSVALLYQLDVLKSTGRYDAFRLKWHPIYHDEPEIWPVPKHLFWDSDVAKWIEGACYFLHEQENSAVRAAVDELVDMIAAAQQPDGYLNIHFTIVQPDKRFSNLRDLHEMYNAGHLIEGALAHEKLYGNTKMLGPIIKYVDLLAKTFGNGSGQLAGYPGHPEIELALLRLYERTKDVKQLELAQFFITERGNPKGIDGQHYYDYEARKRGEGIHEVPDYYPERRSYWYQQAHAPLLEQMTVEGHSVRAMYLLTALADLVRIKGDDLEKAYTDSLYRLWDNTVQKKMYMTGGIGATKQWEGFAQDYYLPQSTDEGGCYAETCASIGVMMLADRLLEIKRDSQVADVLELELYNAVLTGVSCSGREWTYVNQLASSDTDLSQRSDWFTVACCPPNVVRLLGNLGGYIYSASNTGPAEVDLSVHLFTKATISHAIGDKLVQLSMDTEWPLDGTIRFTLASHSDVATTLHIRVPGWARQTMTLLPSADAQSIGEDGYITLSPNYTKVNKTFTLTYSMVPRFIHPHPFTGRAVIAIARGPLVYCAEDFDNDWVQDHFKHSVFSTTRTQLTEQRLCDEKTGESYVAVTAHNAITQLDMHNYNRGAPAFDARPKVQQNGEGEAERRDLVLVPYYFRANRGGRGHMRVGFLEG